MSEPTAGAQQQTTPVCPRHPQRVSYVRCQRCGRPVCPDCQRPAAVGVQCVDCVRAQAKTMRSATTVFGGRVTDTPVVSYAIIALCVLVYVLQLAVPGFSDQVDFSPYTGESEPWRFVTSAFAHSPQQITHILFNMAALWMVGAQYLERLLGAARYAAVYLISAVGGSVVYLLMSTPPTSTLDRTSWFTPMVGASGAVFGLFGALLVLNRHLGRSSAGMYLTIGINAVIGFVLPNVAWQAHLGGLLTGAALAAVISWTTPRERRRWQWPGLGAVLGVLVVLAVVKYALSPGFVLVG
ncbi:rhomboid family intramembrane serine protease [Pedococcus soli]